MGELKIGFFPGVWDLVHTGHVMAFEEAKGKCDYLIVGLQTDPSVDRPQKNKPVMLVEERYKILRGNKWIDAVIVYQTEAELKYLDSWLPVDVRFCGEDKKVEEPYLTKAKMCYVSRNHNYSSSELRKRIYEAEKNLSNGK